MKTTTVTNTVPKKTRPAELKMAAKAPLNSNGSASSSSNGAASKGTSGKAKELEKHNKNTNGDAKSKNDEVSVASTTSGETVIVKSQSPPWKETFDYIADQAFNVAGAAYLAAMGAMAFYFTNMFEVSFFEEMIGSIRLMIFHDKGIPFFGCLSFMVSLRWCVNKFIYPIAHNRIYEGKNPKYTAHYCEWFFDAIKNTVLFSMGACVAFGSDWWPVPTKGCIMWYPPQGGTIFDNDGLIVPTKDLALEVIGHMEVTVDFVALLTLIYDAVSEIYEARSKVRHGDIAKQATTTTSFAEDFVHHMGVCFGALFLYITAKDNCNAIAIIVLLGQFNDMCEFAALSMGLCKNWFLERVATPILCVFWTISLFYIWPACLVPIFLEAIPIEISFDQSLVIKLTLYQFGSVFIASLFWAMHMFWLYKGLLFLYRYQRGVYFSQKKLKVKNGDAKFASAVPMYGRTACIASGTMLKPTKEE